MLRYTFLTLLLLTAVAVGGAYFTYRSLESQLPDIDVLKVVRYQMPMSVYSKDGLLIAQFGEQKSTPVPYEKIPKRVIQAFLSAEDDRFFDHPGVDYQGLLRATFKFIKTGEKRQGGSTITMQVARNFFLSSEKTFLRKLKEILLAIKIESKLPKEQILELYLNKIYFGQHAYGLGAAAHVYFGKLVDDLSLSEIAMLAGLPKAPSAFNPIADPKRAKIRRDYVLRRMLQLKFIDPPQFDQALAEPLVASLHLPEIQFNAPYLAELVRAELVSQYGENAYMGGYKVFTTMDSRLQVAAQKALRETLHEYDERHGYRGVKLHVDLKKLTTPALRLQALTDIPVAGDTHPGLVLTVRDAAVEVLSGQGETIELGWEGIRWARKYLGEDSKGAAPRSARDVLRAGDIIRIRKAADGGWRLAQVPDIAGALVSLDPSSGAVLAMMGGYDFNISKFNRVTQSQRQPGSGFKPILYASALESGFTPASVINDAPFVYYDPAIEGGAWRPQNYSGRFYGPTRLRVALVKSRNLVSIRLLREIGIKKALETAARFGFEAQELPRSLSLALGSGTASPLRMAQAYSVFANGGFRVEPYLIERIETQDGETLFEATPSVACAECEESGQHPGNMAPRAISPQVHYMMHSMLQDVVREGTATAALSLGRGDLAGKTGTTNEQRDTWFNGYSPRLVAVAWMGFDSYRPLGEGETGGHAALPMWIHFMRDALQDVPEQGFPVPDGLTTVRIDRGSGRAAEGGGVVEIFPIDRVPRPRVVARKAPTSEPDEPEFDDAAATGAADDDGEAPSSRSGSEPAPSSGGASTPIESLF